MTPRNDTVQEQIDRIVDILDRFERRLARIEARLDIRSATSPEPGAGNKPAPAALRENRGTGSLAEDSIEFKIGAYWLAHVGSVVLLIGLAFLISYPFRAVPPAMSTLISYLAVAGIFGLSRYWRKAYQHLGHILFGGGLILLYFATLRLHFFTDRPVIVSKPFGLFVVVLVLSANFYIAAERRSEVLSGINLLLCFATALISDTVHFTLIFALLSSGAAMYLLVKHGWSTIGISGVVMAYAVHLLWLLNNPVLEKPLQAIAQPHNNLIYLFLYATVFAGANLVHKSSRTDYFELVSAVTNVLGLFTVSSLVFLTYFKPQLSGMYAWLFAFLIVIAALHWVRQQSRYATSVYACFGYMALSIVIFAQFKSPDYFVWLGWQSLLVISTAIWFRSRIIVLVNILIYLAIFLAYLGLTASNDFVNLSYAVVALTSARVLNWKKDRLELKTDLIRNAYLASAFVMVLYGLHHAVPNNFVSLSWLGAALFYFGLSLALSNVKYRWMAILTIFAVLLRVFIEDMASLDAEFRIALFLAVGIVILSVSFLYSRITKGHS
ncbi:MAG: hypothetical protein ACE5HO_00985 [bacterium]